MAGGKGRDREGGGESNSRGDSGGGREIHEEEQTQPKKKQRRHSVDVDTSRGKWFFIVLRKVSLFMGWGMGVSWGKSRLLKNKIFKYFKVQPHHKCINFNRWPWNGRRQRTWQGRRRLREHCRKHWIHNRTAARFPLWRRTVFAWGCHSSLTSILMLHAVQCRSGLSSPNSDVVSCRSDPGAQISEVIHHL